MSQVQAQTAEVKVESKALTPEKVNFNGKELGKDPKAIVTAEVIRTSFHKITKGMLEKYAKKIEKPIEEAMKTFEVVVEAVTLAPPFEFNKESREIAESGDRYINSYMLKFNVLSAWNMDKVSQDLNKTLQNCRGFMNRELALYLPSEDGSKKGISKKDVPRRGQTCELVIGFSTNSEGELYLYKNAKTGKNTDYGLEIKSMTLLDENIETDKESEDEFMALLGGNASEARQAIGSSQDLDL